MAITILALITSGSVSDETRTLVSHNGQDTAGHETVDRGQGPEGSRTKGKAQSKGHERRGRRGNGFQFRIGFASTDEHCHTSGEATRSDKGERRVSFNLSNLSIVDCSQNSGVTVVSMVATWPCVIDVAEGSAQPLASSCPSKWRSLRNILSSAPPATMNFAGERHPRHTL